MSVKSEVEAFLARHNTALPRSLGQRYDQDRFLPEAGNTVVCHLDQTDPTHRAVMQARARMQNLPGADRFLFTPASSLHMTVFEGVIETRRTPDTWPAGYAAEATVQQATDLIADNLAGFTPPAGFAVRAEGLRPTGLILCGATAQDEALMRAWRDALTVPFGYRHAAHGAYRFHMTFAYPLAWLDDAMQAVWQAGLTAILKELVAEAPVVPLRAPAFCTFEDMTLFREQLVLGG